MNSSTAKRSRAADRWPACGVRRAAARIRVASLVAAAAAVFVRPGPAWAAGPKPPPDAPASTPAADEARVRADATERAEGPAAAGGPGAAEYPALDRLNRECVALYAQLQGSVLRVQMPTPLWAANAAQNDVRFDRYTKLNPDVKRQLAKPQQGRGVGPANGLSNNTGYPNNSGNLNNSGYPTNGGYLSNAAATQPGATGGAAANNAQAVDQKVAEAKGPDAKDLPPSHQPPRAQEGQQPAQGQAAAPAQSPARGQYTLIVPPPLPAANGPGADAGQQALVVGNRGATAAQGGAANNVRQAADGIVSNQVGLLLNEQGDVLVPTYVEREAVGEQPVRVAVGDGAEPIEARFVGSDEQTQLTVLRLVGPAAGKARGAKNVDAGRTADGGKADDVDRAADAAARPPAPRGKPAEGTFPGLGRPVRLSRERLADGTLVLLVSPADGTGRLTVWNNNGAREFGVVVTIDGRVAGIARGGQFLSGSACQLIADQIVRHGAVRRATLGVIVTQVDPADPVRQALPELGDRPAVRVDQVIKGSAADRGGVRPGDLVMAVAGEPVADIPSLAAAIAGRQGPAEVRLVRDGAAVTVTVELVRK